MYFWNFLFVSRLFHRRSTVLLYNLYCLSLRFLIISLPLYLITYYDLLLSCGLRNFLYQHICHLYPSFPFHLALHLSRYIQFRLLHRFHPSFPAGATIIYLAIRLAACSDCDRATLHPSTAFRSNCLGRMRLLIVAIRQRSFASSR